MDKYDAIGNRSYFDNTTRDVTKVNVVGLANDALKGIVAAINEQAIQLEELREIQDKERAANEKQVSTLRQLLTGQTKDRRNNNTVVDEERKRNKQERAAEASNIVRSQAAERRQRATNNIFNQKIDKGFNILNVALEKVLNYLKDIATRWTRNLDDSVRTQRKLLLSSFEIKENEKLASELHAQYGEQYGLSSKDFRKMTDALAEQGIRAKELEPEQAKLITFAMSKMNMPIEKALKLSLASRGDEQKVLETLIRSTDPTGRATTQKILENINSSAFQIYADRNGGTAVALDKVSKIAQEIDSKFGMYMSSDHQSKILETVMNLQSGQLELTQGNIETLTALGIHTRDPEQIVSQIMNGLQNNKFSAEQVQVLRQIDGFKDIADDILLMQTSFNKSGELQEKRIRSEDETLNAIQSSVEGGIFGNKIEGLFSKLDNVTGGFFTDAAVQLNEWFGEDASLESIVSKGLTAIIGLLTTIALSDVIKKGLSSLGSLLGIGGGAAGTGLLVKAKNFLGIGKTAQAAEATAAAAGKTAQVAEAATAAGKTAQAAQAANTAANVGKGAKFVKAFGGKAGVAGAAISLLAAGATIYAVNSAPDTTVSSESSSERFKEKEKENQSAIKTAKTVGAVTEAGFTVGGIAAGAALGAKAGAVLGSVVPGAGTVIGLAVGTAIGAAGGAIVGNITDAIERANNTEIAIENVNDLKDQLKDLDALIEAEGDQDTARKKELLELRAQVLLDLEAATKHNVDNLVANFNAHNEDFANGNADAMSQIASVIEQKTKEYKALEEKRKTTALSITEQNQMKALKNSLDDSRQALAGLAGGEFTLEEGESLDDAIKRIAADVRGDGWLDTSEAVELAAAKTPEALNEFLKKQALDRLTNGKLHESLDDLKQQDVESIEKFIRASNLTAGLTTEKAIEELTAEVMKMAGKEDDYRKWQRDHMTEEEKKEEELRKAALENLKNSDEYKQAGWLSKLAMEAKVSAKPAKYANGGIVSAATLATIGEAGKEAVLPLTKPEQMTNVLSKLNSNEKLLLIKSLLLSKIAPTWDALSNILFSDSGLPDTTVADNIIAFARDKAAKHLPYSIFSDGYVCNTLVHAALKSAGLLQGWDLRYHNVSKWWNDPRLHKVALSEARPGMIGFSNRSKTTGNPQHMGIITENGMWVNASGSAVNGDYSRKNFRATANSKGVVEAPMNTKASWGMVGAGWIDGMFDPAEASAFNNSTTDNAIPSGPSTDPNESKKTAAEKHREAINAKIAKAGLLTEEDIINITREAYPTAVYDPAFSEYIKAAQKISSATANKDEIIAVLLDISRYLKGAIKPPMNNVVASRPYTPVYGVSGGSR